MPEVTETRTFAIKGWPGGINTEDYEHLRQPDEAELCDMMLGPRGEATVRRGLQRLATFDNWTADPDTGRLATLFSFTPDAGTNKYLIAVDLDGKVWKTNAGPGSTISAASTVSAQIDYSAVPVIPSGATLGAYFVLCEEDQHAHYWDGSGNWVEITDHSLDDGGTESTWEFPIASTICSGWSRMWAAGNDTYPSRLFWSGALGTLKAGSADAAGPWNWPSTNWVDINPEDGGEITRIIPFGQAIMVFKNNSVYAFVGAGDPSSARLYPIHLNIGCTLPGTVAESTGRLFWATDDGVYCYDGTGVTRIDRKVRATMNGLAGGAYAKWATGYAISERYHLHFPVAEYGTEGYHYVYNTEGENWELHTDGGWGTALFSDTAYTTRWGGIFTLDAKDGADEVCSQAGALDTAVTVPCYLKTAWLPPPDQRDGAQYRVRRIDLYLERPAVSGSYTCKYYVRLYADYNEATKVIGFLIDVDTLETSAEGFIVKLPGYAGLVDAFRLTVTPYGADGEERIALNGMSFILSERVKKRSPHASLPSGITVEA